MRRSQLVCRAHVAVRVIMLVGLERLSLLTQSIHKDRGVIIRLARNILSSLGCGYSGDQPVPLVRGHGYLRVISLARYWGVLQACMV